MDDLIEALILFAKYDQPMYPTHCEHDTLYVCIDPDLVSEEDKAKLDELGFIRGEEWDEPCFMSFRFGSA